MSERTAFFTVCAFTVLCGGVVIFLAISYPQLKEVLTIFSGLLSGFAGSTLTMIQRHAPTITTESGTPPVKTEVKSS